MRAIQAHPALELSVLVGGTMVLERFDHPAQLVRNDGFPINGEVYLELEGSTPTTMAKSVGFGVVEFASEFQRLKPDVLLIIGDRYEALSAAVAGAYMNICIAHIQGGEVSGSIDESARHSITKFAHFHFPSTKRSAEFLIRMGEDPETILAVGCPSGDLARELDTSLSPGLIHRINTRGSGAIIDSRCPFLLVAFHPMTTQYGSEREQMDQILEALHQLSQPTLLLWPNIDAGSNQVTKAIRIFRDQRQPSWLRTVINLPTEDYLCVLRNTVCAIGNSSSFVRDAGFFGTPVVLVGNRQDGRETDTHVTRSPVHTGEIARCVREQLHHGRYPPSSLYGDGAVSLRIANALARLEPYLQKRLHYVSEKQDHSAWWSAQVGSGALTTK